MFSLSQSNYLDLNDDFYNFSSLVPQITSSIYQQRESGLICQNDCSITHYYQSKGSTCGPTCMRMILSAFGDSYSEEELEILCNTTIATKSTDLITALLYLNYSVISFINGRLVDVRKYLDQGYKIITGHGFGSLGHYIVITKITSKNVYYECPISGPNKVKTHKEFIKEWRLSTHKDGERFFIAIKK